MIGDFLSPVEKYMFLFLSGIIGFVLWHLLYNKSKTGDIDRIRDNIINILQWFNLSTIVFFGLFLFNLIGVFFYAIILNLNEPMGAISSKILNYMEVLLIMILISISIISTRISNNYNFKDFIHGLRIFFNIIMTIFIPLITFAYFYKPVVIISEYIFIIILLCVVLGLLVYYSFELKISKKHKKIYKNQFGVFLIIFFSVVFLSFISINDYNVEEVQTKKITCYFYNYNCDYELQIYVNLEHGYFDSFFDYYNLDYLTKNSEYEGYLDLTFLDNNSKTIFRLDLKNYDEKEKLENLNRVIKLDKEEGIFAFEMKDSIRKNISIILFELKEEISFYKDGEKIIDFPYVIKNKYNNSLFNFTINISTSIPIDFQGYEIDIFDQKEYSECKFDNSYLIQDKEIQIKCGDNSCEIFKYDTKEEISFIIDEQKNQLYLDGEFIKTKSFSIELPLSCRVVK